MGKHLNGKKINAGVSQSLILGRLFFLIYINDLSEGISYLVKLFAVDTSVFSADQNKTDWASQFNNDLDKVRVIWLTHWIRLLIEIPQNKHKKWFFERVYKIVTQAIVQKHIGLHLYENFIYNTHIKEKLSKVYKGILFLRNLSNKLSRQALATIYNKAFIRPHLNWA